jgi:hypothetical protein
MSDNHCKDCCCARSWKALGITAYTGKSIPEHIADLRAEVERLNKRGKAHGVEVRLGKCPKCDANAVAYEMMACLKCDWSVAALEAQLATERERVKELVKHGSAIIPHLEVSHEADAFQSLIESLTTPPSAKEETK